jgi:hypothetical protein
VGRQRRRWASRKEERSGTDAGGQKAKIQGCEEDKGWRRRARRLRIDEETVVISVGWDGTHSVFWRGVKHCSSRPLTGQAIEIWGCLPEGGVLWSAGPPCTVRASTRLTLPRNNLAVTGNVTSATTFDDSQDADHNLQDIKEQHSSRGKCHEEDSISSNRGASCATTGWVSWY